MAQAPRQLRPELSPVHLFGARLRAFRELKGLSQRELGALVFCSGHLIGKVEKADRRPSEELVSRCDAALGADGALIALFADAVAPARRAGADAVRYVPALRRVLDARDLEIEVERGAVSALHSSVARLVSCRLNSNYAELAQGLIGVLPELHSAVEAESSAELAILLAQAYRCADAIADKLALFDLSARIIDLMRDAAERSSDEHTVAATAYVRAETFFATGDWVMGRRMLERAATRVDAGASASSAAAYGSLNMRAAVLAAREGRADLAEQHISEAEDVARRVPDAVYDGTAFGPASVRIHRLALAMDLNDVAAALKTGAEWTPPLEIPAERRSHFFVDLARAHAATGHADDAVQLLGTARQVAPEHVRHHPDVKAMLSRLLAETTRPTSALLGLAHWTQVTAGVGGAGPATRTAN
jgi:transcriptional regulator with XRE-family HTH domain